MYLLVPPALGGVVAMIEVCLERKLHQLSHPEQRINVCLEQCSTSTPERSYNRHEPEQRSTDQIGTPTITTHHCLQYTPVNFTLPFLSLQFNFLSFMLG